MSKKTLNKANLVNLGSDKLADLVLELVEGRADLKRQARMALSSELGSKEIAADIRKRFASIRRATGWIDWKKQRTLVKDLYGLLDLIEHKVAPTDPTEAFELLWSFLLLADPVHHRTDDSNGTIGDVFRFAMPLIGKVSGSAKVDGVILAESILERIRDSGFGEFDGIILATADALGQNGLEHLKIITNEWASEEPSEAEIEAYNRFGYLSDPKEALARSKESTRKIILSDVADAQGDVDAYMALYTPEQLTLHTIAPKVVRRLIDAGRVEEGYDLVLKAKAEVAHEGRRYVNYDLDKVYEECLISLDRKEDLKALMWAKFEASLSSESLRKYLKLLPDFEDIEAEDRALEYAEQHPSVASAARFFVEWSRTDRASKVILERSDELDGGFYFVLDDVVDALEHEYPLAATLLRRAMIEDCLASAKTKRYRYAAKNFEACQASDVRITDYQGHPTHQQFVAVLKALHGRKYSFWQRVSDDV